MKRVRHCRRVIARNSDAVTVGRTDDARAVVHGVQTCGSVWACPVCSARILAGRAEELTEALERHHARAGKVVMVTLTMRHRASDPLATLWDGLSVAWAAARGENGSARRALAAAGSRGIVRRVESTHGRNGWHLHVHALVFLDGTAEVDVDGLGLAMFGAWRSAIARHADKIAAADPDHPAAKLGTPDVAHGVQAQLLDLEQAREDVAGYLAKGLYDAASGAAELTSSVKQAARGNRTPFQILQDFIEGGEARDLALWHEWEQGSHGRQAITWPVKLRRELGLQADEATDDELADEGDEQTAAVVTVTGDAWHDLTGRRGLFSQLMNGVERAPDIEAARSFARALLRAHGIPIGAARRRRSPRDLLDDAGRRRSRDRGRRRQRSRR